MHLSHGKLELIYIARKPLPCSLRIQNYQDLYGISAYRENRGGEGGRIFFFFFPSHPETYNYKKKIKRGGKSSGERQGLGAAAAGAGGQWLLTCLMVRFPSSIQPAGGCSLRAAVGRAQIHQVSHRKQVSLPPLSCLLFPHTHTLPFYSLLGGGPKTMSSFPTFFAQPMKSRQRGGNCPPGSDFKPSPGMEQLAVEQPRQSGGRGGRRSA